MLVKVPGGIEPEAVASLSDNIPDAWRTVGPHLREHPGEPVLICASGATIALYAVQIALAMGARRVDFASADPDGLACALRSTEPEGVCTSIGIYFSETIPVPLLEVYTKGIRFHTGRVHARPAMEPLLDLVREGKLEPQRATGETAAWDDAPEAIAEHRSKLVISRA